MNEPHRRAKPRARVVPLPWQKQISLLGRLAEREAERAAGPRLPSPHAPEGFARGVLPPRDGPAAVHSSRAEAVAVAAKLRQDLGWLETQAAVTYVTYVTVADACATAKGRELRTHRLSLR